MSQNFQENFLFVLLLLISIPMFYQQNSQLKTLISDVQSGPNTTEINKCQCNSTESFSMKDFNQPSIALTPERINGIIYETPFKVGNLVFLPDDFDVESTSSAITVCPEGYEAINLEMYLELQKKYQNLNIFDALINKDELRFNPNFIYLLNDKVYKNYTKYKMGQSWIFRSIEFNPEYKQVSISQISSFYGKNLKTKCVMDQKTYQLKLLFESKSGDVTLDKTYQIFLLNTNLQGALWKTGNSITYGMQPILTFSNEGCNYLDINAILLNGKLVKKCLTVYGIEQWGANIPANLHKAHILNANLTVNATYDNKINGIPENSPFATNSLGLYALTYQSSLNKTIFIVVLDRDMKQISQKSLENKGQPLDIVRTKEGWAVLCKGLDDENRAFILYLDVTGKIIWSYDIFNNPGKSPKSRNPKDLIFYYHSNAKNSSLPKFGMDVMFNPIIGKISYTNGRLAIVLSRFNYFPTYKKVGQADLMFTIDIKGKEPLLGYSWGTSPSVSQRLETDGRNFIVAALGTMFPQNIKVCFINSLKVMTEKDPETNKVFMHETNCKDILESILPSDKFGRSCGRLGGLVYSEGYYAVTYTRKPCWIINSKKQKELLKENKFGLVVFNKDFVITRSLNFGSADKIICVNSALYGKYILITFTITKKVLEEGSAPPNFIDLKTDKSYALVVDFNGSIITKPTRMPVVTCDDVKTTKDGGIAWNHVDEKGNIIISKLTAEV